MSIVQSLLKEMDQEARTTRKMLERVPNDKYDWKPHEKSMTIRRLATHIANIPTWVSMTLTTSELDFANNPYKEDVINNTPELLTYFEKCFAEGRSELEKATDDDLLPTWTLRNGSEIYSESTKGEMIRICFSQVVHHRAQLGVFLRLLD
ncbi:MAG TPA: DinB family protein, partial [Chitinophagaceae bacterium]|nr:DinB family protein [Chitinophagaceae bacterium]